MICSFLLIFVYSAIASVMIFALLLVVENMYFAILDTLENEAIHSLRRAAMLSVFSLVSNFVVFFADTSFGLAAEHSLNAAYMLAACFTAISLILFVKWVKDGMKNQI